MRTPCKAIMILLALPLLTAREVVAAPSDDTLNLVCVGEGEMMGSEYTNRLEWDKYDHKYRAKSGYETRMKNFESAVTIQIQGNDGRIRLPKKLIPPLHSGGDDQHWWQLDDIRVTQDEIRAGYRLNGMNKPSIRIDRGSGLISIKGFGQGFTGRCDKIDEGTRRF